MCLQNRASSPHRNADDRLERALDKMASRVEEAVLLRQRTDRSVHPDISHLVEQLVSMQQSLLREIAHLNAGVGEMSVRLMRAEVLMTASSSLAGMCLGAVAVVLLARRSA